MYSARSYRPADGKHEAYFTRRDYTELFEDCQLGKYKKVTNPNVQLLCAKAYFLQKHYDKAIKWLNNIQIDYSTKVLYERQALLFKSHYLLDRKNISTLDDFVDQYFFYRNKCPGSTLTNFHDTMIRNLKAFVHDSHDKKQNMKKQQIIAKCKVLGKKRKFEGTKSFLIEKSWNDLWISYISKDKEHPGPISNFTLINHIFEFQPPREKRKSYMETYLFPVVDEADYIVLRKEHWEFICQLYGGYPIERLFIYDFKQASLDGGDNIAKMLLKVDEMEYVIQEQIGSYWQMCVFPKLFNYFGYGQLKEETQNEGQYLIVNEGPIYQPQTSLKYIKIDEDLIKAVTDEEKRKRGKLILKYDMEAYNLQQANNGLVGLANLGNTCYMNASLQCLSNIRSIRDYFLKNLYLSDLNISETNKVGSFGSVTCAFGELVKRLWASSHKTRYIDPRTFKKAFQIRFQQFRGNDQEDANEFMYFLLNCLHDDLNSGNSMHKSIRSSVVEQSYENARNHAISSHNRNNKSIIDGMFVGHLFEQIQCQKCQQKRFRFQIFLMMPLQVPMDSPLLKFFLVVGDKFNEEAENMSLYISDLKTVEETLAVIQDKRAKQGMKYYIASVERKKYTIDEFFDADTKIKKIANNKKQFHHIFVYQLPAISEEQAYYCFEYSREDRANGFPRIVPLPKNLWENDEKQQEKLIKIKEQAAETLCIPLVEGKIQKIEEVTCHKKKNKMYDYLVKVEFKEDLKLFNCTQPQQPIGNDTSVHDRTIYSCMKKTQQKQVITEEMGWMCENCKETTQAFKKTNLHSVGDIVTIVLKRFTENGKISTRINYPLDNLDLTEFLYEKRQNQTFVYKLMGVVLHRGTLNYGHYTSVCRNPIDNKWYNYDDDYVKQIPEQDVVSEAAYILFYERK